MDLICLQAHLDVMWVCVCVCVFVCVKIEGEIWERGKAERESWEGETRRYGKVEQKVQNEHKYSEMCFGPKLPRKQYLLDIFVNV